MIATKFIFAGLIGYLWGAIPFGKIYVRLFAGKNIQEVGSGRTGGTNALRAAGWGVGILTGISDAAKGAMGVITVQALLASSVDGDTLPWLEITPGILAVIGHNWSIFAGMRGGAGTGPNVGWATALWGPMFPIAFVYMLGTIYFIGYASVASMTMGLIIPVSFGYLWYTGVPGYSFVYVIGGLITACIVAFSLRGNFKRLMRGEERLVGYRARGRNRGNKETSSIEVTNPTSRL